MSRLQGRIAIVTGAGQGIGEGIARAFAKEGAAVVVAEINEATGRGTADELEAAGATALFVHTDVSQKASVESLVAGTLEAFGRVDILVNNAQGLTQLGRVEHKRDADFEKSLGSGLYATLWGMQAVYPGMRDAGGGRIINLASLNGINAHKYSVDYNAAKEAIRALSRTAAAEWGRHGITVNVIPLGRLGDPERDIAPVAVFLASDAGAYVTGNTLHVDGGGHINGVPWDANLPETPQEN